MRQMRTAVAMPCSETPSPPPRCPRPADSTDTWARRGSSTSGDGSAGWTRPHVRSTSRPSRAARAVLLSLVSDVAAAYYELLELDEELAIARSATESFRESLELLRGSSRGGWRRASTPRAPRLRWRPVPRAFPISKGRSPSRRTRSASWWAATQVPLRAAPGFQARSCHPTCLQDCPPRCSSAAPTCARPSTPHRLPTPASE